MNPYEVLGIARTATPEEIRGAYRHRAKKLHPDAGGDPEAFAELTRAHDILMNPQARLAYDTTGKAEAPKPDDTLMHAYAKIHTIIEGILESSDEPATVPIMDMVRHALADQKAQIETVRANVHKSLRKAEAAAKRFRKLTPGDNILQHMVEDRVRMLRTKIEEAQPHLDRVAKAMEIAADYEFDKENPPPPVETVGYAQQPSTGGIFRFGIGR